LQKSEKTTQNKKCFKLSEVMVGSGIRDPEKTYSGSRIRGAKRYRIPDPESGSATLVYLRNALTYIFQNFTYFVNSLTFIAMEKKRI
jgi:hypothetical protein